MVRFEGVRGMEALCAEGRTFAVRATGRHTISLGETRGCGEFVGGGRLVQVEIWGDLGRCGEVERLVQVEIWGDMGRYGEIRGDVGR